MGITTYGLSGNALLLGPSGTRPAYLSIGSGSGIFNSTQSGLIYEYPNTRVAFASTDISTAREITWTSDFSAITMSGLTLREFGISAESSGGTIWNREAFAGVSFTGTQELQVQITFQIV